MSSGMRNKLQIEALSISGWPLRLAWRAVHYLFVAALMASLATNAIAKLPDLVSETSEEPITVLEGQDVFISCVAKELQNYTVIWRYSDQTSAPVEQNSQALKVSQDGQAGGQTVEQLGQILTAAHQRVTSSDRFSVIQSHDTWLLKIKNARVQDTGTYICHTNSEPPVGAIRILSVLRANQTNEKGELLDPKQDPFVGLDFNFEDCCRAEYVRPRCQKLCSLKQLASKYQGINIVHECYPALPSISRCMVAGRNLTDCCLKRHIPSRCNPLCGHQGDTSAMSLQDQSYCADYSASIMSCAAEGVSALPGQPDLVIVEAISSTTLKVSWQKVTNERELQKMDGWIINLTKLSSFEDTISALSKPADKSAVQADQQPVLASSFPAASSAISASGSPLANLTIVDVMNNSSLAAMTRLLAASSGTVSLKLAKQLNEFSIDNLKPYTVYQIQMYAYNSRGRSQLTDPIRALTLAPEEESSPSAAGQTDAYVEPQLPDTRKCCLDRGVTLARCLDTLCDPVEADRATIADLMICAPWSNITFGCLSSRVNHTDCCKARGVSPFCLSICSGDVKRVDYRHFRCLTHMSSYTNCILESHNVLPSPPLNFTVGPITHSWAVLNWRKPRKHASSLQGYRIFWRKVEPVPPKMADNTALAPLDGDPGVNDELYYSSAEAATNPYLLDALLPETVYETFVVAVNKFGQSESSVRFIFQTLADPEKLSEPVFEGSSGPNVTNCCVNIGIHNQCLHLCDYDIKVQDVSSLVTNCNHQMPGIMRCMAGSRNSVPCCRNRNVSDQCLNVCAGLTEYSPLVVATRCADDFGKIIRCMDEGSKQIPAAPIDLHTTDIAPDRISIKWAPASEDFFRGDVEYHLRYQQLQQPGIDISSDLSSLIAVVPLHPLEHNLILTTNKTEATIDKLRPNSRYSIYVTAENSYGISLPSLVLVIQTPAENTAQVSDDYKRNATLGAPHSLEILRVDTDFIVLKWIAPLFTVSDAQLKYRVFYKMLQTMSASENGQPADQNSADGAIQQVASNWTVLETADTTAVLRNLRYSSQYVITVQAFSPGRLGHMSEILLASTAKPVPPTLNHPLVINNPIEGNNITIMCVALGQPTPQISMFINGLLVQKRTQPYVIYHLVNLVRGHLTITCFASNGQGKDYASVQSRTEVSVKFPSKASAKSNTVTILGPQSTARLTCEISGNPQPTVVWLHSPSSPSNSSESLQTKLNLVTPNDRVSTLLVSQFENPFTWTHTLTIRNVSQADLGYYQCRSRNVLSESSDSIRLVSLNDQTSSSSTDQSGSSSSTNKLEALRQIEQTWDLLECCRSQNISSKCLPVCSVDGLDIEVAFKIPECQNSLDKLMYCAADGSDHRNCCRSRQVPASCLRWCSGAKLNIPALCFLSSAIDINQCFQEDRTLLPGPPRNLRVSLASESDRDTEHDMSNQLGPTTTTTMNANMFTSLTDKMAQSGSSPALGQADATVNSNNNNPSVISSMVIMMGEQSSSTMSSQTPAEQISTTPNENQQRSEPFIIEWDPPVKNPNLVQYYRIFWRPFGSRELSRTVTNMTWIKLSDLNMNKIYEFVVKASNNHGSSVYSDPLTVEPAELLRSHAIGSSGLIWFMPSSGPASLFSRVVVAICFATLFMFGSLGLVLFLEKRGYLKRFASSKTNGSRVSFANPAYLKESNSNQDNVTWDTGHSLDVLAPPPQPNEIANNRPNNNGAVTGNLVSLS